MLEEMRLETIKNEEEWMGRKHSVKERRLYRMKK